MKIEKFLKPVETIKMTMQNGFRNAKEIVKILTKVVLHVVVLSPISHTVEFLKMIGFVNYTLKRIHKPTLFVGKIRYRFFNGKQIINQSGCDKNPLKWRFDLLIENTKTIKVQLFFIGITDFNSLQINE